MDKETLKQITALIRANRYMQDLVLGVTVRIPNEEPLQFSVMWSHIHECYIAAYDTPADVHTQFLLSPKVVSEMHHAKILAFFEDKFKISRVQGIQTPEMVKRQKWLRNMFRPTQHNPKKPL